MVDKDGKRNFRNRLKIINTEGNSDKITIFPEVGKARMLYVLWSVSNIIQEEVEAVIVKVSLLINGLVVLIEVKDDSHGRLIPKISLLDVAQMYQEVDI